MPQDVSRIRRARPADLEALVATRVALFRELGHGPSDAALLEFQTACRPPMVEVLRDGRGAAWLAMGEDGAVRGAAILLDYLRLPSPTNLATREGYLLNVWVAPEWRRQGVASALVEAAIEEGRLRRLARIRLHATVDGRSVYERLGFSGREDEMELVL